MFLLLCVKVIVTVYKINVAVLCAKFLMLLFGSVAVTVVTVCICYYVQMLYWYVFVNAAASVRSNRKIQSPEEALAWTQSTAALKYCMGISTC